MQKYARICCNILTDLTVYCFFKHKTVAKARTVGYSIWQAPSSEGHCIVLNILYKCDLHKFTDSSYHGYDVTMLVNDVMLVCLARRPPVAPPGTERQKLMTSRWQVGFCHDVWPTVNNYFLPEEIIYWMLCRILPNVTPFRVKAVT